MPSISGSYAGWQAGRQNMAGFQNRENPLQVKLRIWIFTLFITVHRY